MTRREYSTFAGAFLLSNKVVAQTETPLLDHPIPRCGERIPAVGLGTAHVFDVNECGARPMQSCRRWSRAAGSTPSDQWLTASANGGGI